MTVTKLFSKFSDLVNDLKSYFSEIGHTHTKSQITDFSHTHTKSQITDFGSYIPLDGTLAYTHNNEINFRGGTQPICWFNYRNADTDATVADKSIDYKFASYSGDTTRSTVSAGTGNFANKVAAPVLNMTGGRLNGSGDDEGIVIGFANNGYAGLILGSPTARRSVFYMNGGASGTDAPFWRYADGSSSWQIYHPKASGTIALTNHTHTKPKVMSFSANYSAIAAGAMFEVTVNVTAQSGFTTAGVAGFNMGSRYLNVSAAYVNGNTVKLLGRNAASAQAGASTATAFVLFIPN